MSTDQGKTPAGRTTDIDVEHVLAELDVLESQIVDSEKRAKVQRVRRMVERVPGSNQIQKYTTRDMGEAFIGGLVFSLPLLVEDGVFEIAEWFAAYTIGPVPIFFTINILIIFGITAGLLYAIDFREVQISNPILGLVPRRLIGILVISFICAAGMMFLWGRLHEGDPTTLESIGRATVIWASAALGAVLADILPGESKGEDIGELIDEIGDS